MRNRFRLRENRGGIKMQNFLSKKKSLQKRRNCRGGGNTKTHKWTQKKTNFAKHPKTQKKSKIPPWGFEIPPPPCVPIKPGDAAGCELTEKKRSWTGTRCYWRPPLLFQHFRSEKNCHAQPLSKKVTWQNCQLILCHQLSTGPGKEGMAIHWSPMLERK